MVLGNEWSKFYSPLKINLWKKCLLIRREGAVPSLATVKQMPFFYEKKRCSDQSHAGKLSGRIRHWALSSGPDVDNKRPWAS